ncbi:helix-turn-helix transcriptional regulator [Bengtsoniella intestinalis]|uniref:helix-turn-helix domain-containing protein n=1 Tax=Bengtsoniella intestinalis TaxID=3073143 RepID=UPI00391FC828
MGIGKRIKYFRKLRGMTQQELGCEIGFSENTADVRIAQYEGDCRKPKKKMIGELAQTLAVHPQAISPLEVETRTGLAHTLFLLEDMYGLTVSELDGILCLQLSNPDTDDGEFLSRFFDDWLDQREAVISCEIDTAEYNDWRYNYHSDMTDIGNIDDHETGISWFQSAVATLSDLVEALELQAAENPHLDLELTIGERIKILRKKRNLTQKGLAKQVGVSEITIRKYEANKFEPKIVTLMALARALDVGVSELDPWLIGL